MRHVPNNKQVVPGAAPQHGEQMTMPAEGGGTLTIYKIAASPSYYGRWTETIIGSRRQISLRTQDFDEAKARLIHRFGEACGGKAIGEPKFRVLIDAFTEHTHLTTDNVNIIKRLRGAFADHPRSALAGKAGEITIKAWHAARQDAARKAGGRVPDAEVLYRHVRLVKRILRAAKVPETELPALPVRPTRRRAHMDAAAGDLAVLCGHLSRRCRAYRVGTLQWHGRMMLRAYFGLISRWTGRSGTEALSITFEGITSIGGGLVRIEVNGKVGPAYRYAPAGIMRLVAAVRRFHPTGTGKVFVNQDGTPRCEMHHLFRGALDALEVARGEPGKWTARFVPGQETPGGVSLYSVRHTRITELLKRNKDTGKVAQLFGTSTSQIGRQYAHLRDEDCFDIFAA